MTERMYDLTIEVQPDGLWRIEQSSGVDDPAVIDLHPAQIHFLAERAGVLPCPPIQPIPRGLLRDLERLLRDADDLLDLLDSVVSFPPRSEESEDVVRASRLVQDIERLIGDYTKEQNHGTDATA